MRIPAVFNNVVSYPHSVSPVPIAHEPTITDVDSPTSAETVNVLPQVNVDSSTRRSTSVIVGS